MKQIDVTISQREVFDRLPSQDSFAGLRDSLGPAIALISASACNETERRAAVIVLLKDTLAQGRARVRSRLEAG